jgi:hypothetical protein
MISIKLFLNNGDCIFREMNANLPLNIIEQYFVGKAFHLTSGVDNDTICTRVEFL